MSTAILRGPAASLRRQTGEAGSLGQAPGIARRACDALLLELATYPKPGLVSHVDSGSHADMDAAILEASARALEPFFARLADAGAAGLGMDGLRLIGIEAEAAMRAASGGVNTHRGAIFGLGLLCAAAGALGAGRRPLRDGALGALVRQRYAAGILRGPELLHAPGGAARRRYRVGGAPAEAAAGFPTIYAVGLPALRRGRLVRPGQDARVEACMGLVATLVDTNLLHRGGRQGLRFARTAAARFVKDGGVGQVDWLARAERLHRSFVERQLSPGGAADLLAMTLFVDGLERAGP